MTTPPSPESGAGPLAQALISLSGVAVAAIIVGLLAYSLIEAAGSSDGPATRAQTIAVQAPARRLPTLVPGTAGSPIATAPAEMLILLLCDDERVGAAINDEPLRHLYIWLRPGTDRGLIAGLLAGTDTVFPSSARVMPSKCATAALERGDFL